MRLGPSGSLLVVRKKLLLLQPQPHHRGNVLMERFLRKKFKKGGIAIIHNGHKNKDVKTNVTYNRGVSTGLKFLLHGQQITGWLLSPGRGCAVCVLTLKYENTISSKYLMCVFPRTLRQNV